VIGEFEKPEQLVHAATKIREAGYRYYECYTPFPVEGMPEAMAMRRNDVPLITLFGGLIRARRFWLPILGECDQLSSEQRRAPAQ
jgi:hypothetical protein